MGTNIAVVGGHTAWDDCRDAAVYSTALDRWSLPTDAPDDWCPLEVGSVAHDDGAFVVGRSESRLGLLRFSVDSQWDVAASFESIPERHALVGGAGAAVLWWGGDGIEGRSTGAICDLATGEWQDIPPGGPTSAESVAAVWTGRHLLLWGGARGGRLTSDGWLYEPVEENWERMPPAPVPARSGARVGVVNRHVVLFGGWTSRRVTALEDGAIFDLVSREWTRLTPPPIGLHDVALASLESTCVVAGPARSARGDRSAALVLHPDSNDWSIVHQSGFHPGSGASVVGADGRVFVWTPFDENPTDLASLSGTVLGEAELAHAQVPGMNDGSASRNA